MIAAAAALDDDIPMADSERRCLGTGEVRPRAGMLRFVVAPDPELGLVPDLAGDLPGRGLWVSADRAALERALARNAFARAARGPLRIAPDLPARVEAGLVRRLVDWLGLARRAGAAVAGFEKTRAALSRGRLVLIVAARDASPAESARLAGPEIPRIGLLTRDELGQAFGRDELVHIGILNAGWAERLATEHTRLAGFRPAATAD
jgi:predicted RNA-binding protein YlxR (DUF448 family)